jgi:hypothetical protein
MVRPVPKKKIKNSLEQSEKSSILQKKPSTPITPFYSKTSSEPKNQPKTSINVLPIKPALVIPPLESNKKIVSKKIFLLFLACSCYVSNWSSSNRCFSLSNNI